MGRSPSRHHIELTSCEEGLRELNFISLAKRKLKGNPMAFSA